MHGLSTVATPHVSSEHSYGGVTMRYKVHLIRHSAFTAFWRQYTGRLAPAHHGASVARLLSSRGVTKPAIWLFGRVRAVATVAFGWLGRRVGLLAECPSCGGPSELFEGRCVPCFRAPLAAGERQ